MFGGRRGHEKGWSAVIRGGGPSLAGIIPRRSLGGRAGLSDASFIALVLNLVALSVWSSQEPPRTPKVSETRLGGGGGTDGP